MSDTTTIVKRTDTHVVVRSGPTGQETSIPFTLPVLPVRNVVVFPGTVMPLTIGRPRSKAALDEVMPGDKLIAVLSQRDPDADEPPVSELFQTGTICSILKLLKLSDGNQSIIVHGLIRFRVLETTQADPYPAVRVEILEDQIPTGPESEALIASVKLQATRVVELSPNTPDEVQQVINNMTTAGPLSDFLAANLNLDVPDKQSLLEELNVYKRLKIVAGRLAQQLDMLELQSKIQTPVKESFDKNQRRYYLQEQVRAIRRELGESDADGNTEAESLRQQLAQADLPPRAMKEAQRELARMESIPQASPEYGVIRTYLLTLSELPWNKQSEDKIDLKAARAILDRDHHDLDKVKRRILEYLAVRKLKLAQLEPKTALSENVLATRPDDESSADPVVQSPDVQSPDTSSSDSSSKVDNKRADPNTKSDSSTQANPDIEHAGAILCFVGPPGVGKTSLGKSIAESIGRKFIRVALGGVRDEAEIRGHRRTYIGSMPGRIISEIRKAGTRNPVMMLDEIDKLGSDFRGDPSSALLEVLDPAQNHSFTDHYLDLPFDLSRTLFIATANTLDTVPPALRDRMEVIEIPGYTQTDKKLIAKQYLVPRQLRVNGLNKSHASFNDASIKLIIDRYTREAGVRNLERNIGSVCRAIAAEIVGETASRVRVDPAYVEKVLGPPKYESELAQRTSVPGVATGLAYTPVGGEILFIEATRFPGKGNVQLTGQIGDVMKESAQAAMSLLKSRAASMHIDPALLADSDVHIHIPAGAIPKDGPSAGIAMFTALASLFLNKPVRHDVAMTGEITLRGLVLPIGGLKEKTLAAKNAGIRHVILPRRNLKDMPDIPDEVQKTVKFHSVDTVDDVLAIALGVSHKKG
jgi:ATP-dependent Lon protease